VLGGAAASWRAAGVVMRTTGAPVLTSHGPGAEDASSAVPAGARGARTGNLAGVGRPGFFRAQPGRSTPVAFSSLPVGLAPGGTNNDRERAPTPYTRPRRPRSHSRASPRASARPLFLFLVTRALSGRPRQLEAARFAAGHPRRCSAIRRRGMAANPHPDRSRAARATAPRYGPARPRPSSPTRPNQPGFAAVSQRHHGPLPRASMLRTHRNLVANLCQLRARCRRSGEERSRDRRPCRFRPHLWARTAPCSTTPCRRGAAKSSPMPTPLRRTPRAVSSPRIARQPHHRVATSRPPIVARPLVPSIRWFGEFYEPLSLRVTERGRAPLSTRLPGGGRAGSSLPRPAGPTAP